MHLSTACLYRGWMISVFDHSRLVPGDARCRKISMPAMQGQACAVALAISSLKDYRPTRMNSNTTSRSWFRLCHAASRCSIWRGSWPPPCASIACSQAIKSSNRYRRCRPMRAKRGPLPSDAQLASVFGGIFNRLATSSVVSQLENLSTMPTPDLNSTRTPHINTDICSAYSDTNHQRSIWNKLSSTTMEL